MPKLAILNQIVLDKAVESAEQIVDKPDHDLALAELISAQTAINNAVNEAKKRIEAKALERSKDFKGIKSDHVVISYRASGSKYKPAKGVDPSTLPEEYVKASTRHFLQANAIELYHDKTGKFPKGVEVAERKRNIVIDLVEQDNGQEKV